MNKLDNPIELAGKIFLDNSISLTRDDRYGRETKLWVHTFKYSLKDMLPPVSKSIILDYTKHFTQIDCIYKLLHNDLNPWFFFDLKPITFWYSEVFSYLQIFLLLKWYFMFSKIIFNYFLFIIKKPFKIKFLNNHVLINL